MGEIRIKKAPKWPEGFSRVDFDLQIMYSFIKDWSGLKVIDIGAKETPFIEMLEDMGAKGIKVDINKYRGIDVVCDVINLPFPDKEFDVVMCFELIEHIDNYMRALGELTRITKSTLFFSTPHKYGRNSYADPAHVNHWTCKDLEKILQNFTDFEWVISGRGINVRNRLKRKILKIIPERFINCADCVEEFFVTGKRK